MHITCTKAFSLAVYDILKHKYSLLRGVCGIDCLTFAIVLFCYVFALIVYVSDFITRMANINSADFRRANSCTCLLHLPTDTTTQFETRVIHVRKLRDRGGHYDF